MIDTLINRALIMGLIAATAIAGAAWLDGKAKARRIAELNTELTTAKADNAALDALAAALPRIERRSRDALAAINAAGERTSDACLSDPRIIAYYDGFRLRDAERHAAP